MWSVLRDKGGDISGFRVEGGKASFCVSRGRQSGFFPKQKLAKWTVSFLSEPIPICKFAIIDQDNRDHDQELRCNTPGCYELA